MSGDTEMDDPEISDGASDNEYSDHEQEIEKEDDDNTDMAEQNPRTESDGNGKAAGLTVTVKPKLDPKDPLRPRRKKARRACFACQRAHLTCGKLSHPNCLPASLQFNPLSLPKRVIKFVLSYTAANVLL
jgi:hypothetical protein